MSDQAALHPDDAAEATGIPCKLLVIDDDTVHRMVICRIARQAGFIVEEAATFEAARRMMSQESYACVTLDLSLGDHGGLEVIQHMAQIGYESPLIVVSGSDDAVRNESFAVAKKLGLNVCKTFSKPLKLADLRDLMREIRKRQVVGLTPRGS